MAPTKARPNARSTARATARPNARPTTTTRSANRAKTAAASFPSFDFSSVDSAMFNQLDEKLVAAVRDAAYITLGFGVLAFQQAQVRRREMVQTIADRFGTRKSQVEELLGSIETQLGKLDERFAALESKLDASVEKLEERLPDQAAAIVGQAHELAKAARQQMRGLIRNAA